MKIVFIIVSFKHLCVKNTSFYKLHQITFFFVIPMNSNMYFPQLYTVNKALEKDVENVHMKVIKNEASFFYLPQVEL